MESEYIYPRLVCACNKGFKSTTTKIIMNLSITNLLKSGAVLLLLSVAACHSGSNASNNAPTVLSNSPVSNATGVPINASVSVTFSQKMDPATINAETFTLTYQSFGMPMTEVLGTVIYANSKAVFWPTAHLPSNVIFTATITTGAKNLAGIPLRLNNVERFTTGSTVVPGSSVDLGKSGSYAILAKSAISTVPTSAITGNLGISPAAASFITGFGLTLSFSGKFSTSAQVTGEVYAADYVDPTPANLTTAVHDMETAFTDAAGRAPDVTELGAGDIGGLTLVPGVYKWGTGLLIPTDVTLSGDATDVWIFQIAQDLTVSSATSVILAGGALPENVFWQVTGLVDIGTTAQFNGIILTATAITLRTGATHNGRLLAQTAVNLDGNTVVEP